MKGKFITFEGCEGAGKSTQLRLLSEYLTQSGADFIMTREPGGSPVSESIRKIILDGKNENICDECEALLYAAARIQHLKERVAPALQAGKLVICDRYVHSSLAYQGYARGLGYEFIEQINSFALENFKPDLTVFLDLPPREGFMRKHGADPDDRMEKLGLAFHEKVYAGYLEQIKRDKNFCAVDCRGTKYQTAEAIRNLLIEKGMIR